MCGLRRSQGPEGGTVGQHKDAQGGPKITVVGTGPKPASSYLTHTHGPAPCSMDKHCACETWLAARRKAGVKQ